MTAAASHQYLPLLSVEGQLYTPYLCCVRSLKRCQVKFYLLLFPLSICQLFIYSASVFHYYRKRVCSLVGKLHMNFSAFQISILTITGQSPLYSLYTFFCKIQLIKCNRNLAAPSQQNAVYKKTLCLFICQQNSHLFSGLLKAQPWCTPAPYFVFL